MPPKQILPFSFYLLPCFSSLVRRFSVWGYLLPSKNRLSIAQGKNSISEAYRSGSNDGVLLRKFGTLRKITTNFPAGKPKITDFTSLYVPNEQAARQGKFGDGGVFSGLADSFGPWDVHLYRIR